MPGSSPDCLQRDRGPGLGSVQPDLTTRTALQVFTVTRGHSGQSRVGRVCSCPWPERRPFLWSREESWVLTVPQHAALR